MKIVSIQKEKLLIETGEKTPSYAKKERGGFSIHWTFLPKLAQESEVSFSVGEAEKDKLRSLAQERRELLALKGVVPEGDERLYETPLVSHQKTGVEFCFRRGGVLLADDVGLGKTPQTIGVILRGFESGELQRAIIVCPASIKRQWKGEFNKFASAELFPDLEEHIVVVDGGKQERLRQYKADASVWIMTYDVMLRDKVPLRELFAGAQLVAADEAAEIKNCGSQRSKLLKVLAADTRWKLALTATPIENGLHDLYSMLEWVAPGVFPSLQWFEREYCKMITMRVRRGGSYIEVPKVVGYRNLDDAKRRIEHVYLRRTVAECGEAMPEVVSNIIEVKLGKGQRAEYDRIASDIRGMGNDTFKVLGALVKIREVCDSAALVGGVAESAKLKEVRRIVEELPVTDKVVIFSEFRKMTDLIVRELSEFRPLYLHGGVSSDARAVLRSQFTDGGARVLVMTSAGERGLNLQVASLMINVEVPWNPARLKQRIGRIWRLGSEHARVRILNLVAENTFEQRVLDALERKSKLFDTLFKPGGVEILGDPIKSMSSAQLRRML